MYKGHTEFSNSFSEEVWRDKYKWHTDNDINETHQRVAKDIASVEENKEYWTEKFTKLQENFKFVPGGRITSNAGTGLDGTTYINCFLPKTQVLTDNGYKNIEDIKINNIVLTHKGKWKRVINTLETKHENINVNTYTDTTLIKNHFSCTENHKFWNSDNTWVESKNNEECVFLTRDWNDGIIEEIDINDYVDFYELNDRCRKNNKIKNNKIKITKDFMYFLGRFVGDGSTFSHNKDRSNTEEINGFNIIFSNKEQKELYRIKDYIEKEIGLNININVSKEFDGIYLRKHSLLMASFLREICGDKSYTKKVPDFVWKSSKKNIEQFLLGVFDSDGTITKEGTIRLVVTSKELVKNISALLWMIDVPNRTNTNMKHLRLSKTKPNRVSFNSKNAISFVSKMKKYYKDNRIEILLNKEYTSNGLQPCITKNNQLLTKCKKTVNNYSGTVYNISVEDDNSYVVSNIKVKNCYVHGLIGEDQDSIEGIYEALKNQAKILKSEGGYGFCCDVMRPRGAHIHGIANQSPGSVKFLELWDKSSEIITAGAESNNHEGNKNKKKKKGFIRKGAMLVSMSCWHPDIINFINAKRTPGTLTKFNMSVLCTDDFMNAVKNDLPWELVFPNYTDYPKEYKEIWDGDINEWVSKVKQQKDKPLVELYHTFESAKELWEIIMTSTYEHNDPGVLFVDTINRMNNLKYCEQISSANPCGEQMLSIDGVCLLGSINLTQFIDVKTKSWNYDDLGETIDTAVRFMDNVNDITKVPLKGQEENLKNKRRIGLGVFGYASALLMCKVKYGSKKALQMTENLMSYFVNRAYQASVMLAKEKGKFPLYNEKEYLNSNFIKSSLSKETIRLIKKHGIRNSHLTSIQPTGNGSVFANMISSGLEPSFGIPGYYRTSIQANIPDGLFLPENVDWKSKKFKSETGWQWTQEGKDNILVYEFNNYVYKFDENRGLVKEEFVEDYGVTYLKSKGQWNEDANWAVSATTLTVDDHVKTMKIFAKYICSAISKTTNLPNDFPYEDFKDIYLDAWESGIKGFTTYRVGTMMNVLSTTSSKITTNLTEVKRPMSLECDVHHVSVMGDKYCVLVGKLDGQPYEVFTMKSSFISKNVKYGVITRKKKDFYRVEFDDDSELCPITQYMEEMEEVISRLTSGLLRSGSDMHYIVRQLEKAGDRTTDLQSFSRATSRALKKYIPDGTKESQLCPECEKEDSLIRMDGCISCTNCGFSKCM
jgi:ribonucleoside-diphosphate reductase alpha chain